MSFQAFGKKYLDPCAPLLPANSLSPASQQQAYEVRASADSRDDARKARYSDRQSSLNEPLPESIWSSESTLGSHNFNYDLPQDELFSFSSTYGRPAETVTQEDLQHTASTVGAKFEAYNDAGTPEDFEFSTEAKKPESHRKYRYFCPTGDCRITGGEGGRSSFLRHQAGHEQRYFCSICTPDPKKSVSHLKCKDEHATPYWLLNLEIHRMVCGRHDEPVFWTRSEDVKSHIKKKHGSYKPDAFHKCTLGRRRLACGICQDSRIFHDSQSFSDHVDRCHLKEGDTEDMWSRDRAIRKLIQHQPQIHKLWTKHSKLQLGPDTYWDRTVGRRLLLELELDQSNPISIARMAVTKARNLQNGTSSISPMTIDGMTMAESECVPPYSTAESPYGSGFDTGNHIQDSGIIFQNPCNNGLNPFETANNPLLGGKALQSDYPTNYGPSQQPANLPSNLNSLINYPLNPYGQSSGNPYQQHLPSMTANSSYPNQNTLQSSQGLQFQDNAMLRLPGATSLSGLNPQVQVSSTDYTGTFPPYASQNAQPALQESRTYHKHQGKKLKPEPRYEANFIQNQAKGDRRRKRQ